MQSLNFSLDKSNSALSLPGLSDCFCGQRLGNAALVFRASKFAAPIKSRSEKETRGAPRPAPAWKTALRTIAALRLQRGPKLRRTNQARGPIVLKRRWSKMERIQ